MCQKGDKKVILRIIGAFGCTGLRGVGGDVWGVEGGEEGEEEVDVVAWRWGSWGPGRPPATGVPGHPTTTGPLRHFHCTNTHFPEKFSKVLTITRVLYLTAPAEFWATRLWRRWGETLGEISGSGRNCCLAAAAAGHGTKQLRRRAGGDQPPLPCPWTPRVVSPGRVGSCRVGPGGGGGLGGRKGCGR